MKRVSLWALHHKVLARVIIVVSYLILNVIGFICGDLFFSLHIILTPVFFYITSALVIITFLVYPKKKKNKTFKTLYARQKIADVLLISATFLFIVYSWNSYNYGRSVNPLNPVFAVSVATANNSKVAKIDNSLSKKKIDHASKKSYKKYVRSIVRAVRKKYKDSTPGQKVLYISLLVIAAILAIFLISALACNIICSGAEALGYLILILGIGGVIFGLVKLIQRVKRGPPQKKKPIPVSE